MNLFVVFIVSNGSEIRLFFPVSSGERKERETRRDETRLGWAGLGWAELCVGDLLFLSERPKGTGGARLKRPGNLTRLAVEIVPPFSPSFPCVCALWVDIYFHCLQGRKRKESEKVKT